MGSKKGFTLVELVIVMAILTILAVAAIPKRVDMLSMRIDLAARKLQSDIRYAQSLANSVQKDTKVEFNQEQDNYSVYLRDASGNWALAVEPLTKQSFTVQLNSADFSGVGIEAVFFNGYNALVFDKWANPYGYNLTTGESSPLTNPSGVRISGARQIMVERGTGRVYIQ